MPRLRFPDQIPSTKWNVPSAAPPLLTEVLSGERERESWHGGRSGISVRGEASDACRGDPLLGAMRLYLFFVTEIRRLLAFLNRNGGMQYHQLTVDALEFTRILLCSTETQTNSRARVPTCNQRLLKGTPCQWGLKLRLLQCECMHACMCVCVCAHTFALWMQSVLCNAVIQASLRLGNANGPARTCSFCPPPVRFDLLRCPCERHEIQTYRLVCTMCALAVVLFSAPSLVQIDTVRVEVTLFTLAEDPFSRSCSLSVMLWIPFTHT